MDSISVKERLKITLGDITDVATDAIVNAANPELQGGGGVDGAIHAKGGPSILQACTKIRSELGAPLPTGDAVITTAGDLPARFVIHTAGPVWNRDPHPERLLARAYSSCMQIAIERGLATIAFPSISTGAFGFPVERAAPIAVRTVATILDAPHPHGIDRVDFVLFSEPDLEIYVAAHAAL